MQWQGVKTLAVHCHCGACSAAGRHSAGRRTSWVCLQHHATVVTSNGVTVCGNKFPPTVSKHCPHQHSAIHKNMPQYETPTVPAVVISKVLFPQPNIMAAFSKVTVVSSLMCLQSCQHRTNMSHNLQFYLLWSFANNMLSLLPKMPNCQHKQYN